MCFKYIDVSYLNMKQRQVKENKPIVLECFKIFFRDINTQLFKTFNEKFRKGKIIDP